MNTLYTVLGIGFLVVFVAYFVFMLYLRLFRLRYVSEYMFELSLENRCVFGAEPYHPITILMIRHYFWLSRKFAR